MFNPLPDCCHMLTQIYNLVLEPQFEWGNFMPKYGWWWNPVTVVCLSKTFSLCRLQKGIKGNLSQLDIFHICNTVNWIG